MKNHLRVLSRIANTPLYISEDKLSILSSNVILPILLNAKLDSGVATATQKQSPTPTNKTAIVNVFDSLVSKGGAGESGFTSYQSIAADINYAINEGFTKIGFYIDSPGGEVSGLFGLTELINSLPTTYGIETFAFTDGMATSAAYAIASATQKVYATSTATLGSIGAVMSLVDVTKLDAADGISYTILRSDAKKALYNPHEAISAEVIAKATETLTAMADVFKEKVTKYRPGVTLDSINTMAGDSFMATKALDLQLADSIVGSIDEVISLETQPTTSTTRGTTMTLEELKAALSAKEAELVALQASVTNTVAKAIADERVRCSDIFTAGGTLKISAEHIAKRITAGTSKEDALDIFTAIAEATGKTTAIDTATGVAATVDTIKPSATVTKLNVKGEEIIASDILTAAKALSNKGAK